MKKIVHTDPSLSAVLPFVRLRSLPISPRFFFLGPLGISLCVEPPDNLESILESRTRPPNSESIDCIDDILSSSCFQIDWSFCCIDWSNDKLFRYKLPLWVDDLDRRIECLCISGVSFSVDAARRIPPRLALSRSFSSSQIRWYLRSSSDASARRARTLDIWIAGGPGEGLRLLLRIGWFGFSCDEEWFAWNQMGELRKQN